MEELGTVLDLGKGTVSFTKINVLDLPLIKTSRGYLAISFLDFNLEKLDDFTTEEAHEGYLQDEVPEDCVHDPMLDRPPGVNPDDWLDQQYELEFLRAEAASCDQVLAEVAAGREARAAAQGLHAAQDDGPTCEDVYLFESLMQEQPNTIRKATHKKAKKLHAMSNAVDGDDWRFFRVLAGKTPALKSPPYGKCWMKQLFAGQMGLTLLLVAYGLSVGVPLDFSTSNWDATTKNGLRQLNHDFQVEDPYCTVLTQPCGPSGNWARFNVARGGPAALTVLQLQERGRPILKLVNDTICKHLDQPIWWSPSGLLGTI